MSSNERFDLLIVGGGIHGVGVAQAAAAAGYSALVLEQSELAAGTSRRSSKLIHGGLRYLETMQLSLVRESLHERELLLKIAPDLVRRQAFFIPIYPQTTRRPILLRLGLSMYAILSGWGKNSSFRTLPRPQWTQLDGLRTTDLQQVFQYWDAQTDDAQLTRAVMKSAESMGAQLRCPAEFIRADVASAECRCVFQHDGQQQEVRCVAIVNAAGPWAREIVSRISPHPPAPPVENVQGSHLELPGMIERGCYYVEAPQDRRAVFVMPWKDRTLLGTTELAYTGEPSRCQPTEQETDYLLKTYQHYFPGRSREVLHSWAGLRVLPVSNDKAFRRSRETVLSVDDPTKPRVLSIFGGKLTGYRATGEKVIDQLRRTLPERKRVADTRKLVLGV